MKMKSGSEPHLYELHVHCFVHNIYFYLFIFIYFPDLQQPLLKLAAFSFSTSCFLHLDRKWRTE